MPGALGAPLAPALALDKSILSALGSTLFNSPAAHHLIAVGPTLSQPPPLSVPGAPRKGEWDKRRKITQEMGGECSWDTFGIGWDGSGLRSPAKGRQQDPDSPPVHSSTVPGPEFSSAFASPILVTPPLAASQHTGMYKTVNAFYFAAGVKPL